MNTTTENLHEELEKYFGFSQFKGTQEAIIRSIVEKHNTFVIMPTGGGKSLCYQLPALVLPGTALVISPLIALMKNQVDSIRSHSNADEVAHFLNSSLNRTQIKKVKLDILEGRTKILFVAPETLTKEENLEFFKEANISFVAVDEAHCISEWGHDFRPEYRRIRDMIDFIDEKIPIIALTATATPKVRSDIRKTLRMTDCNEFVESFNRENLFYEVRPKSSRSEQTYKNIIQFIKNYPGETGIIYVQSRKNAEEIAKVLLVNGIKAAPYHAGLEAKVRTATQDDFLMENVDVIVATIAFGMGIDKPDVRFVIHYDIPKSIENYYQETGRGGRDGLGGKCVAYFSYRDIHRLEKFLRDKSVAERDMGMQLMNEITAYSETSNCRRAFLLHYFGEKYPHSNCGLCDNCVSPQPQVEVGNELEILLNAVLATGENFQIDFLVEFLIGTKTKQISDYAFDKKPEFASGQAQNEHFWHSIIRQALLEDYLYKDIETYGLIKAAPKAHSFLQNPHDFYIRLNHDYEKSAVSEAEEAMSRPAALDPQLLQMLKDLRKKIAKQKKIPPFVIFQDPSLEDMATQYPISIDELALVQGVSKGKAERYGAEFITLITQYVEDNEIERASEFVVKSIINKSSTKVQIINSIDRKIPLETIARSFNMTQLELLDELESIIHSGTKLRLNYYVDELVDEDIQEEIVDYFMEAENDSIEVAYEKLKDEDIEWDEIQLMRLKFLSDMGN